MFSLANTRQKALKQIRTSDRQRIFKKIRERKLQNLNEQDFYSQDLDNELFFVYKKSLIKNQLLKELRQHQLLTMLQDKINYLKNIRQFQYILSVFTNLLGDNLNLDEQQQIALVLIRIYNIRPFLIQISSNIYNLGLFRTVLANLIAINDVLHYIEEGLAMKMQGFMLSFVQELFSKVVSLMEATNLKEEDSCLLEKISHLLIQFFERYFYSQPQYVTQISYKFSRNLNIFKKILKYHVKISKIPNRATFLTILHRGLMGMYQLFSQTLKTSNYPLFFEDPQFLMLPFDEIISTQSKISIKISLNLITNMFQCYQESGLYSVLSSIEDPLTMEKRQILLKKLMQNDGNADYKLIFLKLILIKQQFYAFFEDCFDKYWKQLADSCIDIIKQMEDIQNMKLALQILIYIKCNKCGQHLIRYLISIGAIQLIQNIVFKLYELFPSQSRQSLTTLDNLAGYLVLFQKEKNI